MEEMRQAIEEMRLAAMAYHTNGSDKIKHLAMNFFQSIDMDGNGRVTYNEFVEFLGQGGYHWVHPNIFGELGRNRDGYLDFWDVLTLYYMLKTRYVSCKGCHRACLKGLYFTCVTCFDCLSGDTYDLCMPCYYRQNFCHHHTTFLDSYVLLRSKRCAANINPPSAPQPINIIYQNNPARTQSLEALEIAIFGIGTFTAAGCSIM